MSSLSVGIQCNPRDVDCHIDVDIDDVDHAPLIRTSSSRLALLPTKMTNHRSHVHMSAPDFSADPAQQHHLHHRHHPYQQEHDHDHHFNSVRSRLILTFINYFIRRRPFNFCLLIESKSNSSDCQYLNLP